MPPEMKAVDSSMVTHAGYDEATGSAHLVFRNGFTYIYKLPKFQFDDLMAAGSIGKHFAEHIRPHYKGTKA